MKEYEVILQVENIVKIYDNGKIQSKALNEVNLELRKGEILAIMGSSGSGKSTLLNIIGALDSPTKGGVYVKNKYIKNYHMEPYATQYRSENIGFVFQSYNLLKDLTVEDNIALPLILKGENKKEINIKVNDMVRLMGLEGLEQNRPIELSGGQQQRVAIGRALITKPPVLLADEPTGNLDYNTSIEVLNIIKEMKEKLRQSTIIVTHDPKVGAYADRILFMHDGKFVDEYINNYTKGCIEVILEKMNKILEGKNDKVN